jgi:hypothetical protein
MMLYVFVGERRSPTAIHMGVTWADGRLCAKNLHEALRAVGIEPNEHVFVNAFDDEGRLDARSLLAAAAAILREDVTVVALGQKAARELARMSIPHVLLIHPAARGSIRKRERYQQHVADVLGG